jgi:hypothetical protein
LIGFVALKLTKKLVKSLKTIQNSHQTSPSHPVAHATKKKPFKSTADNEFSNFLPPQGVPLESSIELT